MGRFCVHLHVLPAAADRVYPVPLRLMPCLRFTYTISLPDVKKHHVLAFWKDTPVSVGVAEHR